MSFRTGRHFILLLSLTALSCKPKKDVSIPGESEKVLNREDSINTYKQTKSDALIVYLNKKKSFESGQHFSDDEIKQIIVDLTVERSVTVPELPKLHLITGVLFADLGNKEKAASYYELEIKIAEIALRSDLEQALKQNWRRSKIEALILLDRKEELAIYKKQVLPYLNEPYRTDFIAFFNFNQEDVFACHSLKNKLREGIGFVGL